MADPDLAAGRAAEVVDFVVSPAWDGGVHGMVPSARPEDFDYDLSRALTRASIARRAGGLLMLHAAGLATPSGATAVLVAASGTGKSTATRTLGTRLGYLSDETIGIEPDGRIAAYPKPISLIEEGAAASKVELSPDDLGLLPAPAEPYLAALIALVRDPACTQPELVPMPLISGLVELIPQTSSLMLLDQPLRRLTEAATTGCGPWILRYRDIADCASLIEGLLTLGPRVVGDPPPVDWVDVGGSPLGAPDGLGPGATHEPVTATTRCVRTAWRDAVVSEGSVLIASLHDTRSLDGLGAVLWIACAQPTSVADLVELARQELGDHPEAEAMVHRAVDALCAGGLLAPVP